MFELLCGFADGGGEDVAVAGDDAGPAELHGGGDEVVVDSPGARDGEDALGDLEVRQARVGGERAERVEEEGSDLGQRAELGGRGREGRRCLAAVRPCGSGEGACAGGEGGAGGEGLEAGDDEGDDEGLGAGAVDHDLGDEGAVGEDGLEELGGDVLALGELEHVFPAVDDGERAVGVGDADVARVEPAVGVPRGGGELRAAVVAGGDLME